MIFKNCGLKLDTAEHSFKINNTRLEVVDQYKYLGFILKPAGTISAGVENLLDKASRAWFSISNFIYCNKQLPYNRAIQLFNCLVTPIALYACEFWLPFSLPKKSLVSGDVLLKCWEQFKAETIQQKFCRLYLSVMKKTSRLATLGELGQYPLWYKALELALKYEWTLCQQTNNDTLLASALLEMKDMTVRGTDCWFGRISAVKSLLKINSFSIHLKKNHWKEHFESCKSYF